MSDRIAVMRAGRIEQVAAPEEIFDRPRTEYVADFIGSSNFFDAVAEAGRVPLPDGRDVATDLRGPVRVMARPHNIAMAAGEQGPWRGRVRFRRSIGALVEYEVATDAGPVRVLALRQERARPLAEGAEVTLSIVDPGLCAVYGAS